MKFGKAISWLMGTLQRSLFPRLEECYQVPLTEKEREVVAILELIKIEKFVVRSSSHLRLGRRLRERESIARSFGAKAVYGHPFAWTLMEALKTTPALRRICGFERVAARYKERTAAERFNSRMKEEFGADDLMVRGPQKVKMHPIFGLPALFADQLIKLVT
jgi:hypothetical protein